MVKHTFTPWLISVTALLCGSCIGFSAEAPGNLIANGGFEAGMQIWKGDGKIILQPNSNRICEIEASKSRMKDIKQEFHMGQLQKVEVVFRARSANYVGPGLRITIHQHGKGAIIWNKDLPEDGTWRSVKIEYTRTSATSDIRELNIAVLLGTGAVQIDDVEVREPSKAGQAEPDEPVASTPTATPASAIKPAAPIAAVKPPLPPTVPLPPVSTPAARPAAPAPTASTAPPSENSALPSRSLSAFGSLEEIAKILPPDSLHKLQDSATLDEGITEINAYLAKNVKNRHALLRLTVKTTDNVSVERSKYVVRAQDHAVFSWKGGEINGRLRAYFAEVPASPENTAAIGSEVIVAGVIAHCDLINKNGPQLNIDLQQSQLEQP